MLFQGNVQIATARLGCRHAVCTTTIAEWQTERNNRRRLGIAPALSH